MAKKKEETQKIVVNIVQQFPNVFRAYEIAAVNNLRISLYANLDNYPNAVKDFEALQNSGGRMRMILDVERNPADIFVEMYKPSETIPKHKGEDIYDIIKRVEETKGKKIVVADGIEASSKQLLETAIRRLNLSIVTDVPKIIDLAKAIARTGLYTEIKIEHVAEAIQYQKAIISDGEYIISDAESLIISEARELLRKSNPEFIDRFNSIFHNV